MISCDRGKVSIFAPLKSETGPSFEPVQAESRCTHMLLYLILATYILTMEVKLMPASP